MSRIACRHHGGLLLPLLALPFGLGLNRVVSPGLRQSSDAHAEAEFDRLVERAAEEKSERYHQPIYGLSGARGVYAANQQPVRRAQFRAYVESRDLPRELPGVRGFGFIERVARTDLDAFVAAQRADGAPDFASSRVDDQGRDDALVVKFLDPRSTGA